MESLVGSGKLSRKPVEWWMLTNVSVRLTAGIERMIPSVGPHTAGRTCHQYSGSTSRQDRVQFACKTVCLYVCRTITDAGRRVDRRLTVNEDSSPTRSNNDLIELPSMAEVATCHFIKMIGYFARFIAASWLMCRRYASNWAQCRSESRFF